MTTQEVDELCRRIEEESIWRPDPTAPPRRVPKDSGDDFLVAPAPIVPPKLDARSPAETPYRNGALLLYVQKFGANDAIAAALSP